MKSWATYLHTPSNSQMEGNGDEKIFLASIINALFTLLSLFLICLKCSCFKTTFLESIGAQVVLQLDPVYYPVCSSYVCFLLSSCALFISEKIIHVWELQNLCIFRCRICQFLSIYLDKYSHHKHNYDAHRKSVEIEQDPRYDGFYGSYLWCNLRTIYTLLQVVANDYTFYNTDSYENTVNCEIFK